MKKTLQQLTGIAFIAIALLACNAGGGGDPKSVIKKFFEAFKTMNIDEAAKYATKDSKSMLEMMKMGMSMAPQNIDSLKKEMDKQTIEYGDPVIKGDEATVLVTTNGNEKTSFKLKKEDGAWKVAFDKNSLMQTGMEKMKEHKSEGAGTEEDLKEAMKAVDMLKSDSMQEVLKNAGKELEAAGAILDSVSGK